MGKKYDLVGLGGEMPSKETIHEHSQDLVGTEEVTVQYMDGTKLGDKDLAPGLVVSTLEGGGGGERESSGDLRMET
jgi:hypothetical protein